MAEALRVAVLASGSGTNLQALLDRFHGRPDASARVVRVIASRPGIGALERARRADVPHDVLAADGAEDGLPEADRLRDCLASAAPGLVVLAGYLRKIPAGIVARYRGRMINIHPALLPSFGGKGMYGARVHAAVLEAGARVTGVTVHFVDEEYDRGPIIAQWPVPVREGDDAGRLARRTLDIEHRVLPEVVSAFARGHFRLEADGRCRWEKPWLDGARFALSEDGGPERERFEFPGESGR